MTPNIDYSQIYDPAFKIIGVKYEVIDMYGEPWLVATVEYEKPMDGAPKKFQKGNQSDDG